MLRPAGLRPQSRSATGAQFNYGDGRTIVGKPFDARKSWVRIWHTFFVLGLLAFLNPSMTTILLEQTVSVDSPDARFHAHVERNGNVTLTNIKTGYQQALIHLYPKEYARVRMHWKNNTKIEIAAEYRDFLNQGAMFVWNVQTSKFQGSDVD